MRFFLASLLLLCSLLGRAQEENKVKTFIMNDVRTWRLTNMFTHADTIPVDTATNLHQVNNPLYQQSLSWVTTGNIGAPAQSLYYADIRRHDGNIFLTPLLPYIEEPEEYVYYNTKTPYANFTYQNGYPKRRSEEYVHILFTQNVNRRLNVGAKLQVRSSIGRFEHQRNDHADFRLHSSFNGDYYNCHGSLSYHKVSIQENGGIIGDSIFINPGEDKDDNPEDMPVKTMNGRNRTSLYRLFFTQSMEFAHVERLDEDSVPYEVPVVTGYHTMHLETTHREFRMSDVSTDKLLFPAIFPNTFQQGENFKLYDPNTVRDTTRYMSLSNTFQLKLTEEYNSLFRFGFRAFIEHRFERYTYPDGVFVEEKETQYGDVVKVIYYNKPQVTNVNSIYIGGEISKHRGENLSFDILAKYCLLDDTRMGSFVLDGRVNTSFPLFGRRASVWGRGTLENRSPSPWEENYVSNIYSWSNSLESEHGIRAQGGVRLDDWNTEISGYGAWEDNKVYFGADGVPCNSSKALFVCGAQLKFHLQAFGFNTITRCAVQYSDLEEVMPLPLFAVYTSNFFEHRFFDVLTFQLGFDMQYNTKYYAAQYNPATMQFCSPVGEGQTLTDKSGKVVRQRRKVGGHPFLDPYVNIQIKRVRAYFKYSHVNSFWSDRDYFIMPGYPANPHSMKFGISWNFYD